MNGGKDHLTGEDVLMAVSPVAVNVSVTVIVQTIQVISLIVSEENIIAYTKDVGIMSLRARMQEGLF